MAAAAAIRTNTQGNFFFLAALFLETTFFLVIGFTSLPTQNIGLITDIILDDRKLLFEI